MGNAKIDFDQAAFGSPGQLAWKAARVAEQAVGSLAARGCIGQAWLLPDQPRWLEANDRVYVLNSNVTLATLVDTFKDEWDPPAKHDRRWVTLRDISSEFGVPRIERGMEGSSGRDFRLIPHDEVCLLTEAGNEVWLASPPDALPRDERLIGVFNAINGQMASYAYAHWQRLAKWKPKLLPGLRGPNLPQASHPAAWMPRPLMAFRLQPGELYHRVVDARNGNMDVMYDAFRTSLAAGYKLTAGEHGRLRHIRDRGRHTVVTLQQHGGSEEVLLSRDAHILLRPGTSYEAGTVLAEEYGLPVREIQMLPEIEWRTRQSLWFARQGVKLVDGWTHYPIAYVYGVPADSGRDLLAWDVSHCAEFLNDELKAFVFPAMPIDRRRDDPRHRLVGTWLEHIPYDLRPADPRYVI